MANRPNKKKAREKRVAEQKRKNQQQRMLDKKKKKAMVEKVEGFAKVQKTLEARVLLGAIGLEETESNLKRACSYTVSSKYLCEMQDAASAVIATLFVTHAASKSFSKDEMQGFGLDIRGMALEARRALKLSEKKAALEMKTPIGKMVLSTDDLEKKVLHEWGVRSEEFRTQSIGLQKMLDDKTVVRGRGKILSEAPDGTGTARTLNITDVFKITERYRLGVLIDFYRDLFSSVSTQNTAVNNYFISQLYGHMNISFSEELTETNFKSYLRSLRNIFNDDPGSVLPDPTFYGELKSVADKLNEIRPTSNTVRFHEELVKSGISSSKSADGIVTLGSNAQIQLVREAVMSLDKSRGVLFNQFVSHPHFKEAYQIIRNLGTSEKEAARFLRDYGDYQVNGNDLAEKVIQLRGKNDSLRSVVDNALFLCCDDSVEELLDVLDRVPNAHKIISSYVLLAKENQPYKQIAVIQQLKKGSRSDLGEFMRLLDQYDDDFVGEYVLHQDDVARAVHDDDTKTLQRKRNSLKELRMYETIRAHGLIPETEGMTNGQLENLDRLVIETSRLEYQPVLLGQATLRSKLLEQLGSDPEAAIARIAQLPKAVQNPYEVLRDEFSQVVEEPLQKTFNYSRIIVVSEHLPPETSDFIEEQTSLPLRHMTPGSSTDKFNSFTEDDLILYDVTRTDHTSYYKAKHIATKRGSTFVHANTNNRHRLLDLIVSQ